MTPLSHKNVCGFDVAVNNAFCVCSVERIRDLNPDRQHRLDLQRSASDTVFQCHAVEELHSDKRLMVLLPDFIDRADIGMIQGGSRLRLALKPSQRLGVVRNSIREKLQGDKSVQGYVLGLVDYTHAAAAEFFDNAVVRDGLTDHRGARTQDAMLGVLRRRSQRKQWTGRWLVSDGVFPPMSCGGMY